MTALANRAALRVAIVTGALALLFVFGGPRLAAAQPAAAPAAMPAGMDPAQARAIQDQIRQAIEARGGQIVPTTAGAVAKPPAEPARSSTTSLHGDTTQGNSISMALLFWAFAAACVGGALFVISRANLITAVMGMVGTFLAIAAVYMMLYASFLSIVQILVYAGAIMVLFVFVIMILNRPEDEPFSKSGKLGKGLAAVGMAYILLRLTLILWKVTPPNAAVAKNAPAQLDIGIASKPELVDWGSTKAVGASLFTNYLFLFEAISILLLIAVVGAIAVARPLDPTIENPGDNPGDDPTPASSAQGQA